MTRSRRGACPCCGASRLSAVARIDDVPSVCNVLCRTAEEARGIPRSPIALHRCDGCGLIANVEFDPARIEYAGTYENALHFSPAFREYLGGLARALVDRHGLAGRTALEIGCGDAAFLRDLLGAGMARAVGVDPAHRADDLPPDPRLRILVQAFDGPTPPPRADLVVCRHVLEHMPDPRPLLRALAEATEAGGVVFLEVPSADYMVRSAAVWDVLHEHPMYFGARALASLLPAEGWRILRLDEVFHDQFIAVEAMRDAPAPRRAAASTSSATEIDRFARALTDVPAAWRTRLRRVDRTRTLLWGAGTKGVMFLNRVDPAGELIAAAVDTNPRKQGGFVAGTGHPIIAPDDVPQYAPARIVTTNPAYGSEIAKRLDGLDVHAEVLAA